MIIKKLHRLVIKCPTLSHKKELFKFIDNNFSYLEYAYDAFAGDNTSASEVYLRYKVMGSINICYYYIYRQAIYISERKPLFDNGLHTILTVNEFINEDYSRALY